MIMDLIGREILLQWRVLRGVLNASLFFLVVLLLFPLGFEANPALLKKILPGLVWIAALFAFLLSAEHLFYQEYEDGVLAQWVLSDKPMHVRVRVKLLVHWMSLILPLMLACFLIALCFDLNQFELGILMLGLLCGTPSLYACCAFSAVFGLGLKHQGFLSALIVLPLVLPILVFGGGILTQAMQGIYASGHLALLLAVAVLSIWGMPYAISVVIRMGVADASA